MEPRARQDGPGTELVLPGVRDRDTGMSRAEACAYYGVNDFELEGGVSAGEICDRCFELYGDCEHTEER